MTEIIRHCPDCGRDRPYAQQHATVGRCPDASDGQCPEWFCLACGTAVILGDMPACSELALAASPRDRVA
jgi:hypothetical protein